MEAAGIEAIILAGGLGTRLRQVIPDLPKPMAPIRGRPFLEYQMDYWLGQGVTRFILSVGYKHQLIQSHFGAAYRGKEISYVVENHPLGTGGGLLLALPEITKPGPVLVLNGDTYFEVDLEAFRNFHRSRNADISLSLFRVESNSRYMEIGVDERGRIISLKPSASAGGGFANGGVYLMDTSLFSEVVRRPGSQLSLEEDLFPELFRGGKSFFGFSSDGIFIDIGVPEDFQRAGNVLPLSRGH